MIDWLRALADRPIAEHERRLAFALAAAIIVIAAGALVLTRGSSPPTMPPRPAAPIAPSRPIAPPPPIVPPPAAFGGPRGPAAAPADAAQDARVFLRGYLAYLYGRAPARAIRGATPPLVRRLERERPRVSPATRARHPRIVALTARRIAGGRVAATATIADGGVARYPILVVLTRHRGRWQATDLSGD